MKIPERKAHRAASKDLKTAYVITPTADETTIWTSSLKAHLRLAYFYRKILYNKTKNISNTLS
ncbi:MAG: hypothetical protein A2297_08250 [Elusimicrobia bacterium RIFOXYB2_FULL_48_7]|nr:MAG: hypothetical protein A2297_08250 [Elusimicrobia bacterium RIFOXYB2_FULL_48_7]